ncbi:hypothetical protein LTR17_021334 [Elasticomyces elasticus]|nr:hypothetical protein LTR17_021334 [Elasticomyces elasticus]
MADPLSITASVIAVIQITSKVVSLCYDYRAGLKNGPKEIKQFTDEIVSFRDSLESISKLVEAEDEASTQLSTISLFTKADGILFTCQSEMTELENDLKPASGIRGVARSLKWPYARAQTEKRVERLGWLKSSLTLALATDHISLALETQRETKQIKLHIQTLGMDLESHRRREEYRTIKTLLDAPDPSSDYLAAKLQRDPGSGNWLIEDKRYGSWRNASPSLLWLMAFVRSSHVLNLCEG